VPEDITILGTGNDDEKNPINDDVEVKGPTPVNITYAAELEIISGIPADIVAAAEGQLRALFDVTPSVPGIMPLGIGYDATKDRLNASAMVPGVKRINTDFVDVAVPDDGLAVLETLTLTWAWASEE